MKKRFTGSRASCEPALIGTTTLPVSAVKQPKQRVSNRCAVKTETQNSSLKVSSGIIMVDVYEFRWSLNTTWAVSSSIDFSKKTNSNFK